MLKKSLLCAAALLFLPNATAAAQGALPGWTIARSGETSAVYTRDGSDSDLLLVFDLDAEIDITLVNAEEAMSLLTQSGECGAFGPVRSDRTNGVFRAETSASAGPACAAIVAATPKDHGVMIVGKSISATGNLTFVRSGADQLLAARTGKAIATTQPSTSAKAAPIRTAQSTTQIDAALKSAVATVPKDRIPVLVETHGTPSYSGWPPSYVYTVSTHLYFANGFMTTCADWDPGVFAPTPQSLGKAKDDCTVARWRRGKGGVEIELEPGKWSASESAGDGIVRFKAGERLDIAFGNIGATGFNSPGGVNVGTISGSDLTLTRQGDIAIGDWSTTVVSGANVGGGSSRESGPLVGRYWIDGHVIAVADQNGQISRGFIAGVKEGSALGHVYLNGTHYWNSDD